MITLLLALLLAAPPAAPAPGASNPAITVTVSAAASLQNAFTPIGRRFEAANPGTRVTFNFGASGQLVQQLAKGAPADVLATADVDSMDKAEAQKLIVPGSRMNFAGNTLVLIVPADAGAGVASIQDLRKEWVKHVALGSPDSVPAGRYAQGALELAALWDVLKDRFVFGQNVRQVLDYVARGEVEAGFVYATDTEIVKDKVRVVGPVSVKQEIVYPIAAVASGGHERAARSFIAWVAGSSGQEILAQYGFKTP